MVLLPLTDKDLLNRSHLLYQVLEINGYRVYLEFVKMLHTPAEYPKQLRHFPPKVTMLIEGNYNSLEYSLTMLQNHSRLTGWPGRLRRGDQSKEHAGMTSTRTTRTIFLKIRTRSESPRNPPWRSTGTPSRYRVRQ